MGMSTDEWRLLISTRATGRGDRTTGRDDNSCGALIDGRGERHTAFIDHMPEHPSDEYRQLHEWADGYGWMLTPAADRLADRIIDGMDPHPTPGVVAALASCYPDRLIMADTRAVRRPAERWFHEAGPLRLDRYMRGGMGDVARMIVHDRLHADMPVLAGRRLDELIDIHAYDALIATGHGRHAHRRPMDEYRPPRRSGRMPDPRRDATRHGRRARLRASAWHVHARIGPLRRIPRGDLPEEGTMRNNKIVTAMACVAASMLAGLTLALSARQPSPPSDRHPTGDGRTA